MRRGLSERISALFPRRRIARSLVAILAFGLVQVGLPSYTFALPPSNPAEPRLTAGSGGCASNVDANSGTQVTDISTSGACILKFISGSNRWTPPVGVTSVWILVIGGGGAGGYGRGGGGGAGGVYENKSVAVNPGTSYQIEVAGSAEGVTSGTAPAGGQSRFGPDILVNGGGGGGSHGVSTPNPTSLTGASGGGSGMNYGGVANSANNITVGSTVTPQSFLGIAVKANGGAKSGNTSEPTRNTGGGGGAGGAGVEGLGGDATGGATTSSISVAGSRPNGGPGAASSITGSSVTYAGGGGGAVGLHVGEWGGTTYTSATFGLGGLGGGGNGGYPRSNNTADYVAATDGAANTGSGGGGGGDSGVAGVGAYKGGNGGSGVVIVRWLPPVVATTVSDVTVPESHTAQFSYGEISVAGVTSVTRQWQFSIDGGTNWNNVSGGTGSTTDTYTTGSLSIANSGWKFRGSTTISDGFETTTSYTNIATLTVILDPSGDTDTALTVSPSGGYAWAPDTSEFDINQSITMEAWVYPTGFTAGDWNTIINKGGAYELGITSSDGVTGYYRYGLSGVNNDGSTKMFSGINTGVKVALNEWHHVAVTKNWMWDTVSFYLDGRPVFRGSADSATSTNGNGFGYIATSNLPLVIGARSSTPDTYTTAFKGKIDQVMIFQESRSYTDINNDLSTYTSPAASNLVAMYDFNEGAGNTLYNKVIGASNRTDLSIVGTRSWTDAKIVDTTTLNNYTIVKFPRSYLTKNDQGWKVPSGVTKLSALIVGGGGAGGRGDTTTGTYAGGGGAGGYVTYLKGVSASGYQRIQVGAGGQAGGFDLNGNEINTTIGANSLFGSTISYGGQSSLINNSGAPGAWSLTGAVQYYSGTGGNGAKSGLAPTVGDTGVALSIGGTVEYYGGGGGGGGGFGYKGVLGGTLYTGKGGDTSTAATSAINGFGAGGGGGGFAYGSGGNGGSGVVIVRWLVSSKPVFTQPVNAFVTVGQYETFSVNMMADSATVGLTRSFRWESSTSGTNGPWATIKQGTGIANTFFSWLVLDTSTTGSQYLYRVVVSDLDADGLGSVETSTAVYATISSSIRLIYPSVVTKTVGVSRSVTMTASGGSAPLRYSLSGVTTLFSLDTATVGSPIFKISDSITVGIFFETITVTDSNTATLLAPITVVVSAPPSFGASSTTIDTGTVLFLDAGNSVSYPKSGKNWNDISGRNLVVDTNFVFTNPQTRTMADGSTSGGTHIILRSTTCTTPAYSSEANGSMVFDGTNCGYIPIFGAFDTYTAEIWMKRNGDQDTSYSYPICTPTRDGSDQTNFCLFFVNSNKIVSRIKNSTTTFQTSGLVTPNNAWFHVAVTFNGSLLKVMIDNDSAKVDTVTVTGTWNKSLLDAGLIFGKLDDFDNARLNFVGSIGSVRIFNRVLSATELTQDYNATKGRFLTTLNKSNIAKKWGVAYSDTFTITAGSETLTAITSSSSNNPLIVWDTSTARSSKLTIQSGLTAGTYYETLTATDIYGSVSYLPIKIVVSSGDTITVSVETATVMTYNGKPATVYPRVVIKGLSGTDSATVQTSFTSLSYSDSLTVPTNADTYTVRGANLTFTSGSLSNYAGVVYETSTLTINKARQNPLNIFMYGGVVGVPYLIWLQGGNGTGAVTETLTGQATLTGCAIANHYLTATEQKQGYCEVRVVKAGDQNYFSESSTVQLYFMAYFNNQPSGVVGGGSTIAINGKTTLTIDDTTTVTAPFISGFTLTGNSLEIQGSNFGSSPVTVVFNRNKTVSPNPTPAGSGNAMTITVTVPVGAISGPVLVITAGGEDVTDEVTLP